MKAQLAEIFLTVPKIQEFHHDYYAVMFGFEYKDASLPLSI